MCITCHGLTPVYHFIRVHHLSQVNVTAMDPFIRVTCRSFFIVLLQVRYTKVSACIKQVHASSTSRVSHADTNFGASFGPHDHLLLHIRPPPFVHAGTTFRPHGHLLSPTRAPTLAHPRTTFLPHEKPPSFPHGPCIIVA